MPVEKKTQVSFHLEQHPSSTPAHTPQCKGHKKQPELKRVIMPSAQVLGQFRSLSQQCLASWCYFKMIL